MPGKSTYLDRQLMQSNAIVMISILGVNTAGNTTGEFEDTGDNFNINNHKPLIFFLDGQTDFNGGNKFEAPLENAFKGLRDISNSLRAGLDILGKDDNYKQLIADLNIPQISGTTQIQTVLEWINSDRKTLTIPVWYLKWRKDQSIIDYLTILHTATMPAPASLAGEHDVFLAPPGNNFKGTCAVKIGKWFESTDFALTSFNLPITNEFDYIGEPLYLQGSISLTAKEIFTSSKITQWLKRTTGTVSDLSAQVQADPLLNPFFDSVGNSDIFKSIQTTLGF